MNKVVTFLSNLGQMILQGLNLIPSITKTIESSSGQPIPVLDKLSQIAGFVQSGEVIIEQVKTMLAPGTIIDKAHAIGPLVQQVVLSSELAAGKELIPGIEAEFTAACTALGGDVARILNCFKPNTFSIAPKNIPAPTSPTAVLVPISQPTARAAKVATDPAPAPAPLPSAFPALLDHITNQISEAPGTAAAIASGLSTLPQD